jgi:hypothetical protein
MSRATTAVLFSTLEIIPVPRKIRSLPKLDGCDGMNRPMVKRFSIATEATIKSHKMSKLGLVADASHSAGGSTPMATKASAPPTKAQEGRTPPRRSATTPRYTVPIIHDSMARS